MTARFFEGLILAMESSCDETSVALIRGHEVLTNVVASQIELHQKWGGVVPEAASRAHVQAFLPTMQEALDGAGLALGDVDAIAVSNRPGLVGALSVGVTAAKALTLALDRPLIGIHHLDGHLSSPLSVAPDLPFPHLSLVVSGGHTELVEVLEPGGYRILAETRDDAAGEAFDKGARLMGLGYPGGRQIQERALSGDPKRYRLPRAMAKDDTSFSFSGLKTAMLRLVEAEGPHLDIPDAAASLQEAIVDALAKRVRSVLEAHAPQALTLVGGVAANHALRRRLADLSAQHGVRFVVPPFDLCTDNAAMIGLAASVRLARGEHDGLSLDVFPSAPLPTVEST